MLVDKGYCRFSACQNRWDKSRKPTQLHGAAATFQNDYVMLLKGSIQLFARRRLLENVAFNARRKGEMNGSFYDIDRDAHSKIVLVSLFFMAIVVVTVALVLH